MKEKIIKIRNKTISFLYKRIAKPIFFKIDPEKIHNQMLFFGKLLGSNFITRLIVRLFFGYSNKTLRQNILGIEFKNPVGLAAGFDKNAEIIKVMGPVGFGYTEIGSITGRLCKGNSKPRLWRIIDKESLAVNYGLNNQGSEILSRKLIRKKFTIPVGVSIAKTNCKETVETKQAIEDYLKGFKDFSSIGDYYTINISCPNAYGGEPFTDPEKLKALLVEIDKLHTKKPIFLKIALGLSDKELKDIVEIADKHHISGFICTNLAKDKDVHEKGAISGKIVEKRANKVISKIYKMTNGESIIIGVGGISSAEGAYEKIKQGASLIQLITGMIYEGPQLISEINQGLVELLKKDGYTNISEATGKAYKK